MYLQNTFSKISKAMFSNDLTNHIQKGQWQQARDLLRSDLGTQLAKTVTTTSIERSGFLPLHVALVSRAEESFVFELAALHEGALRERTLFRSLPLHLAIQHGASERVIEYFVQKYPAAQEAKDAWGRTPRDCAKKRKVGPIASGGVEQKVKKVKAVPVEQSKKDPHMELHRDERKSILDENKMVRHGEIFSCRVEIQDMDKTTRSVTNVEGRAEEILTKKGDSMDKLVNPNVEKIMEKRVTDLVVEQEMKTVIEEREMEAIMKKLFALERMMECSKQNCNQISEGILKNKNEIFVCRSTIQNTEKIIREGSQATREFSEKLGRVEEKLNDSILTLRSIEHN